jgi:hypothetical protein
MKTDGYKVKEIWKESRRRGEVIGYQSFTRHFRICWKNKREFFMRDNIELAKRMVARKFIEQEKILKELGNSLKILKEELERIRGQVREGTSREKDLVACLAEIRQSLKLIWELSKEIEIKPSEDVDRLKQKLLKALKEIPYQYIVKIERALEL